VTPVAALTLLCRSVSTTCEMIDQEMKIILNLKFSNMKKISKLQINSEKLMKNKELLTLKGGYDGWLVCIGGSDPGCSAWAGNCTPEYIRAQCNLFCPGWTSAICAGG
jgi:hypothetical protein